jgi:hypothetical protein
MARIVSDDDQGARLLRQLHERLVIRVVQDRLPIVRQGPLFAASADGVQEIVDLGQAQRQGGRIPFQDFLIFVSQMVAQNGCPLIEPQSPKDFK